GAITAVHPEIISVLLDRVQETIDQVGMVRLLTICYFESIPSIWEWWHTPLIPALRGRCR
ncbi:hypothetical protein ACQP3J_32245, partial [Escherichia coli]